MQQFSFTVAAVAFLMATALSQTVATAGELGTFLAGEPPPGVALAVYSGGTVEGLATAAPDANLFWTVDDEPSLAYLPNAPVFANRAFLTRFASGIPAYTPLFVLTPGGASVEGPPTAAIAPSERGRTLTVAASDAPQEVQAAADYVADGSEDQIQIQAAIDALPATGGTVSLSAGTFATSATIIVRGSGIRLAGLGWSTRIVSSNLADHVVDVSGNDFEIDHLALGHQLPQIRSTKAALRVTGAFRVSIHHVEVTAATGAGVVLRSVSDASVTNSFVHDTLADGIHVTGASRRVSILENRVNDTGDDSIASVGYQRDEFPNSQVDVLNNIIRRSGANGVKIEGTDHAVVSSNDVQGTAGSGIVVAHSSAWRTFGAVDVMVSRNVVRDANSFEPKTDSGGAGIFVSSRDTRFPVADIVVSENTVVGGGRSMVFVGSGGAAGDPWATHDVVVVGNRLRGPNAWGAGLQVQQAADVVIGRNIIDSAFGDGIRITQSVEGTAVVASNLIRDPAIGAGRHYAIVALGRNTVITENIVEARTGTMIAVTFVRKPGEMLDANAGAQ
jgi:parallel beta helix pectate lyase-like protein